MSATAVRDVIISKLEVCINVREKRAAKAWNADMLGIHFDARDRAEVGGVTVVLWEFPDARPASHVVYQFVTDDLAKAHAALLARGAPVTAINPDCLNFGLADPDGNQFVIYQPRETGWRA